MNKYVLVVVVVVMPLFYYTFKKFIQFIYFFNYNIYLFYFFLNRKLLLLTGYSFKAQERLKYQQNNKVSQYFLKFKLLLLLLSFCSTFNSEKCCQ